MITLVLFALAVTVATIGGIAIWSRRPPVPVAQDQPRAAAAVPAAGAFNLSDPVHLLAVLVLAGGLLLALVGLL